MSWLDLCTIHNIPPPTHTHTFFLTVSAFFNLFCLFSICVQPLTVISFGCLSPFKCALNSDTESVSRLNTFLLKLSVCKFLLISREGLLFRVEFLVYCQTISGPMVFFVFWPSLPKHTVHLRREKRRVLIVRIDNWNLKACFTHLCDCIVCNECLSCLIITQKNGTHEGEFVFHTGEENYLDYGKIDTWNGLR